MLLSLLVISAPARRSHELLLGIVIKRLEWRFAAEKVDYSFIWRQ